MHNNPQNDLVHSALPCGKKHVNNDCIKSPPMFVRWCMHKTPYPMGSIVLDDCGCLWGHLCPDGEYAPPGKGVWKAINPLVFAALLIDPVSFLVRYLPDAMSCTELTSKMMFKMCDENDNNLPCSPTCLIVKEAISTGCRIPVDCNNNICK